VTYDLVSFLGRIYLKKGGMLTNKFILMKILQPLLAALTLCITPIAQGVEYKTLKLTSVDSEIAVLPKDIVEVVYSSSNNLSATFQFQDGSWATPVLTNSQLNPVIITGATKFRVSGGDSSAPRFVTLKITPAEAVAPTTVLVLPETPGGNYDLVVESSGDTVTWAPFHSQAVLSGGANAFFHVRIVKK